MYFQVVISVIKKNKVGKGNGECAGEYYFGWNGQRRLLFGNDIEADT